MGGGKQGGRKRGRERVIDTCGKIHAAWRGEHRSGGWRKNRGEGELRRLNKIVFIQMP